MFQQSCSRLRSRSTRLAAVASSVPDRLKSPFLSELRLAGAVCLSADNLSWDFLGFFGRNASADPRSVSGRTVTDELPFIQASRLAIAWVAWVTPDACAWR